MITTTLFDSTPVIPFRTLLCGSVFRLLFLLLFLLLFRCTIETAPTGRSTKSFQSIVYGPTHWYNTTIIVMGIPPMVGGRLPFVHPTILRWFTVFYPFLRGYRIPTPIPSHPPLLVVVVVVVVVVDVATTSPRSMFTTPTNGSHTFTKAVPSASVPIVVVVGEYPLSLTNTIVHSWNGFGKPFVGQTCFGSDFFRTIG